MFKRIISFVSLVVFLGGYYYLLYAAVIKDNPVSEFPALRSRWGTIMWHSSAKSGRTYLSMTDPQAKEHIYCYWPKGETQYEGKGGEYIIKRQDDGNCEGWYGKAIFHEGSWVSEREKLWWSQEQKLQDSLIVSKSNIQETMKTKLKL